MRQHRAIGPRFGAPGVHGERPVEHLAGQSVILGVNRVIGQQQQGGHVAGIVTESGLQGLEHQRTGAWRVGPRQTEVRVRIGGEFLERFAEDFGGQRVILLVEGQLAAGQVGLPKIRVGLFRLVEKVFQDQLRLGPHAQRRLAQRDQIRRVAIHSSTGPAAVVDLVQQCPRPVGVAVSRQDVAAEQQHADARAVTAQRVGERGLRLGIATGCQERLHEQQGPFFIALPVADGLFREADALRVIAAQEQFSGL